MIKTILLADDSITMQKVIRLTFASGGYELYCADNGDEALKKAEELKPNIVLVDAALPGLNGYEVCEAIKNNPELRDTPVIILAGTFNPLDDQRARSANADDSIVKPFESKQLTEKVESLFRKYPPREGGSSSGAVNDERSDWADDDIISAPEPAQDVIETPSSFTENPADDTIEATSELPDLDIMEGRGIIGETQDAQSATIPDMKTAEGESEGESGFDIEGFEINPFKSEPLRESSPLDNADEGLKAWNVEEKDLIAFNDLETEEEIEVETSQPFAGGVEGDEPQEESGQEPVEAEEEPSEPIEDTIEADEEQPSSEEHEDVSEEGTAVEGALEINEEGGAGEEAIERPSEEWIRELVEKTTREAIEEAIGELAPGLVKEAVEKAVQAAAPGLIKEAVEEAAQDAAPGLVKESVEEAVQEAAQGLMKESIDDIVRERACGLMKEVTEEVVREGAPGLIKEVSEEVVRDAAGEQMKEVIEEIAREAAPGQIKEAMEDEMERIRNAIRGL